MPPGVVMKFARYEAHGEIAYGVVEGDVVKQITAAPYEDHQVTDHTHPLSAVKLLAPVVPGKVVAIGLNYRSHLGDVEPPKVPEPFLKTTTSVIGPGETIVIPREALKESVNIQPEAEMTVVIGRRCKRASKSDALSYVLGYTCGNDVSARPWQRNDLQWWRGKGSDTFAPLGPFIATGLDPTELEVKTRVDGVEKQSSSAKALLFDIPTLISAISGAVTLNPGDVIYSGTPGVPPELKPGSVVEVEVTDVGVLRNPVRAE
jgi:2-keto-4-pentenoate hydratase/2-oxohepta-3-ene-1,7-dioic acid hydratase in catechol pathway